MIKGRRIPKGLIRARLFRDDLLYALLIKQDNFYITYYL